MRLIALHKMKLTALAQGCCTVSSSLEEYGDRTQLGCLFISTLGELQRGTKQNMNDGHVTKGLPESFHDNCPQRMYLPSGRYQPQKPFDIIYTARCRGQAGARFMKDTSLVTYAYVIVKLFFVLNKIISQCISRLVIKSRKTNLKCLGVGNTFFQHEYPFQCI